MYVDNNVVTIYMPINLYQELFDSEVDPYDLDLDGVRLQPSQIQFIQGMISAEEGRTFFVVSLTEDGFDYLVRIVLPESMERWYTSMTRESTRLIKDAQEILTKAGIETPY